MTIGLFDICMHPRDVRPGMVMWAPEYGRPLVVKSITEIPPDPKRPGSIDWGWRIEYAERLAGRTWPRNQQIRIY